MLPAKQMCIRDRSDTDRTHDRADYRSMGDAVEESKAKQGAKAPAPADGMEKQRAERKPEGIRKKDTSKICIEMKERK